QSMYVPMLVPGDHARDRLAIEEGEGFRERLLAFVNSSAALASCAHCLGTVGKQEPQRQLSRLAWEEDARRSTEEMVDWDWLRRCELDQGLQDDCKIQLSQGVRPMSR